MLIKKFLAVIFHNSYFESISSYLSWKPLRPCYSIFDDPALSLIRVKARDFSKLHQPCQTPLRPCQLCLGHSWFIFFYEYCQQIENWLSNKNWRTSPWSSPNGKYLKKNQCQNLMLLSYLAIVASIWNLMSNQIIETRIFYYCNHCYNCDTFVPSR